ncbi:YHS domain-containing protein [Pseudothauera rhizosphaerae]|uniref:YHS domain-containing protein n=1 Tax=Pseudothauera rhizosphaerae TaxID=2565932 RepID=A0A4S4AMT7_9RHOO|nr:YHS domain-containing protein [Pseudothauera rhizosphaerae]THF60373.1 YHS domain-containing protein [Pseudothauera rhizosphaerae]
MDMKATQKKMSLKDRYRHLTRGLDWETTYQPMDVVFPYDKYEGIKVHDWDKWEDPFRLTMDAYWKYQAEKERKLYAILDSFNQSNGHLNVTDARYINAIKIFFTAVPQVEYMAHRGFSIAGRQFRGVGPRVACQMQAIDEIRHAQTQIHTASNYNKYYNGINAFVHQYPRMWYQSVGKSFIDDAITGGPFEWMVAIGFSFEYVLTNLVFVPFVSGAAYNGDVGTMTFGFSAQSDEARHMTLGLECIKFMLEQDPDNLPIVQGWIDKWTWRGTRFLSLIGAMMDYMLPKRVMSWREAWDIYFEQNGGALFRDLARYGIKVPDCVAQAAEAKEHVSHQLWAALYQWNFGTMFHTWIPSPEELDWLSAKYPDTFDKYYRPRWEMWAQMEKEGKRYVNAGGLGANCQVCQFPMIFTEPGDPTKLCHRQTVYKKEKYHFCSDHCQHIFENEPEKYIQSWLPVNQMLQGNMGGGGLEEFFKWVHLRPGIDNMGFEGSEDQRNFAQWRGMATTNS